VEDAVPGAALPGAREAVNWESGGEAGHRLSFVRFVDRGTGGGATAVRVFYIVFVLVFGLVGLWGGYWLGHLAGWSEDADWPGQIGGGFGAMALSVVIALVAMAIATAVVSLPTFHVTRRLLRSGTPAKATVIDSRRAGLTLRTHRSVREKVSCRLEVRPAEGAPFRTRACQFMTPVEEKDLVADTVVDVRYDPKRPRRAAIVTSR
jgi:hypothetical protein